MKRLAPIALIAAGVLLVVCPEATTCRSGLSRLTAVAFQTSRRLPWFCGRFAGMRKAGLSGAGAVSQLYHDREGRDYEALRKHVSTILEKITGHPGDAVRHRAFRCKATARGLWTRLERCAGRTT